MLGVVLRLLVGFFAPAAVGVLIFDLATTTNTGPGAAAHFYSSYMRLLPYVYPLVATHSAAYALLMELVVNRFVSRMWLVVVISALLGALSGLLIDNRLSALGGLTGLIVGVLLSVLYRYSYTAIHDARGENERRTP